MLAVFRFILELEYNNQLLLPENAQILSVQQLPHDPNPVLYVMADTSMLEEYRTIHCIRTAVGIDPSVPMKYIGTVGAYDKTRHVFEEITNATNQSH